MPIKFKPSEKRVDRNTKKVTIIHNYIKQMSKDSLFEYINSSNPNRKRRAKCINELQRRGIKLVWN